MKLEQLKINGFGILNDLAIDFEPDLTVIYGLNGSGKSTLLNFLRSVLYGFYHRGSPRRYEPLRGGSHGGSIVISEGGQRYLLSRVGDRRSGGVLIIEDLQTGVSLPEEHVQRLIGGISQSLFETVYAFGLSELQQLKFIQDQDLSALLYSIGLGADISLADIYDSLDTAMDSIYKSRGSKPELNRIQALLVENSARIKAMSGITRQYQELTAEI
ncbi:MAG: AAA family ATPase, partial [Limnochordia bacterium]